jgi:hypothetical protein
LADSTSPLGPPDGEPLEPPPTLAPPVVAHAGAASALAPTPINATTYALTRRLKFVLSGSPTPTG